MVSTAHRVSAGELHRECVTFKERGTHSVLPSPIVEPVSLSQLNCLTTLHPHRVLCIRNMRYSVMALFAITFAVVAAAPLWGDGGAFGVVGISAIPVRPVAGRAPSSARGRGGGGLAGAIVQRTPTSDESLVRRVHLYVSSLERTSASINSSLQESHQRQHTAILAASLE
ncbi:hypothetical protein Hypma_004804 [Hypsizygus marmoreus]|uniref:Transmembrane protein n=1 Tax=Hypsizygus marmoreus TaxID=39966 RepID=A0A369IZT6_HYPMA|nr:hypothetical protein Hypma_004804 [Hypsizygus marmoreus]